MRKFFPRNKNSRYFFGGVIHEYSCTVTFSQQETGGQRINGILSLLR